MTKRIRMCLVLLTAVLISLHGALRVAACCAVFPSGKPVVNADQTVVILWDAAAKTQHFIRQASFKSQADDFGFLIPTPSRPRLSESGNEVFPFLLKLTEPDKQKRQRPSGINCGCSKGAPMAVKSAEPAVRVLEEKLVAGFRAAVLEADSATDLVKWLGDNGYAFSLEVQAWAEPYIKDNWKITALKVEKTKTEKENQRVAASALHMSFETDRPIFPYREPDSKSPAEALSAKDRLLRIYFLADARYQGNLTDQERWTGKVAWANSLKPEDRQEVLRLLKLPATTGPAEWWLTEFEDHWPYRVAPADLYFAKGAEQHPVKRPPIIEYVSSPWPSDVMVYAFAAVVVVPPLLRRVWRR